MIIRTSSGARNAVEALADEAVRWVRETLFADGATDREWAEHVGFLAAALAAPAPELFADYVRWLSAVNESRGAPVEALDDTLALLRRFYEDRLDPATSSPILDMLDAGRNALTEHNAETRPLYHAHLPEAMAEVETLTQAILRGDIAAARALARSVVASHGYVAMSTRLFQPALYAIGLLWQQNQITVAQEHLATAITQNVLAQLYATAEFARPTGRKALFAAVAGNQHALGLRMVSDSFEISGWSVQYLGADTPTDALIAQVEAWRPEMVGLSASLVQQLTELKQAVSALREALETRCPRIVVGGLPINQIGDIWRWTGADAWSPDAEKAVSLFA